MVAFIASLVADLTYVVHFTFIQSLGTLDLLGWSSHISGDYDMKPFVNINDGTFYLELFYFFLKFYSFDFFFQRYTS